MANRFFAADLHMGHAGMIMFKGPDQTKPLRPWGRAVGKGGEMSEEEKAERVMAHDEAIIENWNRVVGPSDKVYVLGDVIIGRKQLPTLGRLNGKKKLYMGNHDVFIKNWNRDYQPYFTEISAYKVFDDLICSHIPLHPESVKERWKANVHGHLHANRVMMDNPAYDRWRRAPRSIAADDPMPVPYVIDPIYLNVSLEQIDYTPICMDEVYARIAAQQEEAAEKYGWERHSPWKK